MRRKTSLPDRTGTLILQDNADSDQSISDEEADELDAVCLGNIVSLQDASASATNKEELPLPARLDFLKGQDSIGTLIEDEVEMPDFPDGNLSNISGVVVANSSDEEIISDDEGNTVLSIKEFHKYGPQFIRNEQVRDVSENSEALLVFRESGSCSTSHATCSKTDRSGIWKKVNLGFSLPSLSHKYGHIGPSISNFDNTVQSRTHRLPDIGEALDPGVSAHLDGYYLEDGDRMESKSDTEPIKKEALAHGYNLPSMADRFDNLQDKTNLFLLHDNQGRGKTVQLFQKRTTSHLQDAIIDCEDSCEPVDCGSTSDNEVIDQHLKITFPGKKMQTMADRFQEALGASRVTNDRTHVAALNSLRAGIFGNLQHVIQKEKERDMDFLRKLQTGTRPESEIGCVDVKIISRYLEGKLTVCHCSLGKHTEKFLPADNSKGMVFSGRERTIIFSPRICYNVDLEVGNLMRIHPPWKEVQVRNDKIILCTYFSDISSPD